MLSFPGKLRLALGVPQHHLGEIQTKATSPLPSVWVRLTGQFPDFRRREHDSVRTQSRDSLAVCLRRTWQNLWGKSTMSWWLWAACGGRCVAAMQHGSPLAWERQQSGPWIWFRVSGPAVRRLVGNRATYQWMGSPGMWPHYGPAHFKKEQRFTHGWQEIRAGHPGGERGHQETSLEGSTVRVQINANHPGMKATRHHPYIFPPPFLLPSYLPPSLHFPLFFLPHSYLLTIPHTWLCCRPWECTQPGCQGALG